MPSARGSARRGLGPRRAGRSCRVRDGRQASGRPRLTAPPIRATVGAFRQPGAPLPTAAPSLSIHCPTPVAAMHEFQVVAVFVVISAIYVCLFLAAERFFMKDE